MFSFLPVPPLFVYPLKNSTPGEKAAEAFRKCQLLPLGVHHMLCSSNKHISASCYENLPEYDLISLAVTENAATHLL